MALKRPKDKRAKLTTDDIYNGFQRLKIEAELVQIQELTRSLDFNKVRELLEAGGGLYHLFYLPIP